LNTDVKIDQEFLALCPSLTPEEANLLEASIDAHGCRDPLIVWKEEGLLIDGHNRHGICKVLGKPYATVEISLPDRAAAINWIIANQLGRRNLTEQQKVYLRGKRYREEKKAEHARPANENAKRGAHNEHPEKTSERLGKEYGVAPATIRRDAQFSKAVDDIEAKSPGARDAILSGQSGMTKKDVVAKASEPAASNAAPFTPPAPPVKKIGDTFTAAVKGLSQRISGIRDQHGTVEAMFKSKEWKGSDIHMVADFFHEVVKDLSKLDKEMQEYVRKHPQTSKA